MTGYSLHYREQCSASLSGKTCCKVPEEMDLAALPKGSGEGFLYGKAEPLVGIADDETDPIEPSLLEIQ